MHPEDGLTRDTLRTLLLELGYDPDLYSLEGRRDRRKDVTGWVIDHWSNRWVVYHLDERGNKDGIRKYRTEADACQALLARLRGDP